MFTYLAFFSLISVQYHAAEPCPSTACPDTLALLGGLRRVAAEVGASNLTRYRPHLGKKVHTRSTQRTHTCTELIARRRKRVNSSPVFFPSVAAVVLFLLPLPQISSSCLYLPSCAHGAVGAISVAAVSTRVLSFIRSVTFSDWF